MQEQDNDAAGFAQGVNIKTPADQPSETFNDVPQMPKQKPVEVKDTEANEEKPQSMPTAQSHDGPITPATSTQEPENVNNDDSDVDLSFLNVKE